jgi:hypothetical protein
MPEYLAPGVYVEETSFRAKSIEGVGTSTAAFVGLTARGPASAGAAGVTPPLLTSFTDFELYYGGLDPLVINNVPVTNYLAHAANAFFANGGGRLYVARVLAAGAAPASGDVTPAATPAADAVTIRARFAGGGLVAGSTTANYHVRLVREALDTTKQNALRMPVGTLISHGADFAVMGGPGAPPLVSSTGNLTSWNALANDAAVVALSLGVEVTGPAGLIAEYSGLGFDPRHSDYAGLELGPAPPSLADALTNPIQLVIGSGVDAFELSSALLTIAASANPVVALTGGTDGTGDPVPADYTSALERLLALEDISIVAAPGSSALGGTLPAAVNQLLIGHAEARRAYRIAVLDTPPAQEPSQVRTLKNGLDSKYAALYYPWIRVADPRTGADLMLPPSGFVCGIYARNDIQRGVFKAPANETVTGALGLQRDVRFGEQEVLNPLGINCIRALSNRGIRVWGARTLSSDPEWKYVNVRRYFLYLEASIDRGTQWAVFEPNGERLWANITTTVTDFLYNEWISGALLGTTPKEAFFVRCDRSTMTQNDLDNGRLICLVGVAALKPAEFVIFRIGQKTADSRE